MAATAALALSQAEEPPAGHGLRELLQMCILASAPADPQKGIVLDAATEPDYIVFSARGSDRHGLHVVSALLRLFGPRDFGSDLITAQQSLLRRFAEAQQEIAAAVASRAGLAALYPDAANLLKPAAAYRPVAASTLSAFWRQALRPNRLAVAVSGPVSMEDVRRALEDVAGAWVPGPDIGPPPSGRRAHPQGIVRLRIGSEESAVWVGVRGPKPDDEDYPVAIVGMMALAHGMGSRLFRRLRDELGVTYAVSGRVVASRSWPHMYVAATCEAADTPRVSGEIQKELQRMAREDLSPKELERARNMAVLNLEQVRMSNWQAVHYLSTLALLNPSIMSDGRTWAIVEDVKTVDAGQVKEFFARWWDRPSVVQVIGRGEE
ncbi:MAG: insulinase family protein [Armatimonadetes bacterium]|nr:insulinase family protein [Armatimonadota bacterium]